MPEAGAKGGANGGLPLSGVRVLDLTRVLSGPFTTLVLADLGAEVWKVEHPDGGDETRRIQPTRDGESHYFMAVNRNKASVAIDLKADEGRELARALAQRADVVVENFRPGVAERLGLGYEDLAADHPGLVYCSISAFGGSGPDSKKAAFDVAIQALSGLMHITGEPGGNPMRAGVPVADLTAGLAGAVGILGALFDRERTGRGRHVDVGMLEAMMGMLAYYADRYFMTGEEPERTGNGHQSIVPYGHFAAADGDLVIATLSDRYFEPLCRALGRPDLAADPRFATNADRVRHRAEVDAAIAEVVAAAPLSHWQAVFSEADIPHSPVLSVGEALAQPQMAARGAVRTYDHPRLGIVSTLGPVVHFGDGASVSPSPPPLLGQDTAAVLARVVHLDKEAIERLIDQGVLGGALHTGPE